MTHLIRSGYVLRIRRGRVAGHGRSTNSYQVDWEKLAEARQRYKKAGTNRSKVAAR